MSEGSGWVGRALMLVGAVLIVVGALHAYLPRLPWLGHLPGDFTFTRGGWRVQIPLATSLVLSVVLSLLLWLSGRLFGRRP